MIEIAVIVFLVLLISWEHYQNRLERNRLVDTIISKNAQEAANLRYMDKLPKQDNKSSVPDLIPLDEVPDEAFEKLLRKQLANDEPENE
jgi:hypothetical protein